MYEWQEVIATSIGLKHKFNAIFIFSPKRGTESQLITSLKAAQLDYPVFLDSGGLFLKRNPRIPSRGNVSYFLARPAEPGGFGRQSDRKRAAVGAL